MKKIKPKVSSFYIIISAFFKYKKDEINLDILKANFVDWNKHLIFKNEGYPYSNYKTFNKFIKSTYYDLYCENMFPNDSNTDNFIKNNENKLLHLTHKKLLKKPEGSIIKKAKEETPEKTIQFYIEYGDLYLFPDNTGVVSVKFTSEDRDIESIADLSFMLRHIDYDITIENKKIKLNNYFQANILEHINVEKKDWEKYNPKYKVYTVVDFEKGIDNTTRNNILFDIGNAIPYGSCESKNYYHPADEYFKEQMDNNKISIFNTWSALALFDTFTVLINESDDLIYWEPENFLTYIHTLHMKFYMYVTNSRITNVTIIDEKTEKLKNKFIEFINDYYHAEISYNFLPDIIYQKLLYSLGIKAEMKIMERKIQRLNETAQEIALKEQKQREQRFNKILIAIAILSIASSIHDFSDWIVNLGINDKIMFPWLSISIAITVVSVVVVLFTLKKRK